MTRKTPGLDDAYALKSPEDSRKLYADWAASYDTEFAGAMDYLLPAAVAEAFAAEGGEGPVLDVGAGTGLAGLRLASLGVGVIDGVDISAEMLLKASEKRVYRRLFAGDVTGRLDAEDGTYRGILSSGTFTLGHVGPEAIDELLRVAAQGAIFVLSINAAHYEAAGFAAKFRALEGRIAGLSLPQVPIYGPRADPAHRADRAFLATFRKA
ncbi:class I SAM-dependent methyltransferase [Ostreiculturibacter nitratireducens]|uniref:class I SAM-dependent DNA methyltransferase n=1 Tax=Ostreiculturibacter nitratireducens TaxID=3075226 RepID=UPI0031B5DC7D